MSLHPHPLGDIEYVLHSTGGTASPVVLLHEGLGSTAQWGRFPHHVARAARRDVLVYSRHGHGGSGGSGPDGPDYLHRQAHDVLPELLDDLGIAAPVLVGHSDGATIAAIYAAGRPVQAVVLIAPHVFAEPATREGVRDARDLHRDGIIESMAAFHRDPAGLLDAWASVWLSDAFAGFDITPELTRITAPTLVIQGADDEYGSLRHADRIAESVRGPVRVAVLPDVGHHPHVQSPRRTADLVVGHTEERACRP